MNKLNSNKLDIFEKDKLEIGLNILDKNIIIQEPDENEKRQNLYIANESGVTSSKTKFSMFSTLTLVNIAAWTACTKSNSLISINSFI